MKARIKSGTIKHGLTIGKEYEVFQVRNESSESIGRSFSIVDDFGVSKLCLENMCSHLSGGSWELIEYKKGARGFFRRLFRLNK